MQRAQARLAWAISMVIVAAVIATLAVTGHGVDALMMALLASLLIGAYVTRRNVRVAILYNHLTHRRPRPRIDSEATEERGSKEDGGLLTVPLDHAVEAPRASLPRNTAGTSHLVAEAAEPLFGQGSRFGHCAAQSRLLPAAPSLRRPSAPATRSPDGPRAGRSRRSRRRPGRC